MKYRSEDIKQKYEKFCVKAKDSVYFLSSIKCNLNYLYELLSSYKENSDCNTKHKICTLIASLQNDFKSIKLLESAEYEALLELEKSSVADINNIRGLVSNYNLNKVNKKYENVTYASNIKSASKNINIIGQFSHNWLNNDHNLFLKIYNRYASPKREAVLQKLLFHIASEDIDKHHEKYKSYLDKVQQTKSKLEVWKKEIKNIKQDNFRKLPETFKYIRKSKSEMITMDPKKMEEKEMQLRSWKETKKQDMQNSLIKTVVKPRLQNENCHKYSKQERQEIRRKIAIYKMDKLKTNIVTHARNQEIKCILRDRLDHKNRIAIVHEKDKISANLRVSKINATNKPAVGPAMKFAPSREKINKPSTMGSANYMKATVSYSCHLTEMEQQLYQNFKSLHIDLNKKRSIPTWKIAT